MLILCQKVPGTFCIKVNKCVFRMTECFREMSMQVRRGLLFCVLIICVTSCAGNDRPVDEFPMRAKKRIIIRTSINDLREYQANAEEGAEAYRFDPLATAMREMHYYFYMGEKEPRFNDTSSSINETNIYDKSLWEEMKPKNPDGRFFRWRYVNLVFDVHLRQFAPGEGKTGIWYPAEFLYVY